MAVDVVNPRERYTGWVAPLCWMAGAWGLGQRHRDVRIPRRGGPARGAGDAGRRGVRLAGDVRGRRGALVGAGGADGALPPGGAGGAARPGGAGGGTGVGDGPGGG